MAREERVGPVLAMHSLSLQAEHPRHLRVRLLQVIGATSSLTYNVVGHVKTVRCRCAVLPPALRTTLACDIALGSGE